MAKTITIKNGEQTYTLEFTRDTVRQLEARGFDPSEVSTKPLTMIPMLFEGAFLCHHRNTKKVVIDEIYKKLGDKETFLEKLSEMYNEPVDALVEEPEEGKNLEWGANW